MKMWSYLQDEIRGYGLVFLMYFCVGCFCIGGLCIGTFWARYIVIESAYDEH